jgi:predicted RNA-binding Zn-ribbon protein involved in translation (DUF1610 family)
MKESPQCPKCGAEGLFLRQTFDFVDGFFTIVHIYICPECDANWFGASIAPKTKVKHAPKFEIKQRGRWTKYYTCQKCGFKCVAWSLKGAREQHKTYLSELYSVL